MAAAVDFWFEFASTYSYLAVSRIEREALAAGVVVTWRPFLLGPIFKAQDWNDSPFNVYPVKGRYMWRDMERLCDGYGIPFKRPTQFPRNGLLAARVTLAGGDAGWVPGFVQRAYRANFAEDRDIAGPGRRRLRCRQGEAAREHRGSAAPRHLRRAVARRKRRALLGKRPARRCARVGKAQRVATAGSAGPSADSGTDLR
jgi:hypothetical protein